MRFKITKSKTTVILGTILFIFASLMFYTGIYILGEKGWFKTIVAFCWSAIIYSVFYRYFFDKNYVLVLRNSLIIHQSCDHHTIKYEEIKGLYYSLKGKRNYKIRIVLKNKKKAVEFKMPKSDEFIHKVQEKIGQARQPGLLLQDTSLPESVETKPFGLKQSKWVYWLCSTVLLLCAVGVFIYAAKSEGKAQWIPVLLAALMVVFGLMMALRQLVADQDGLSVWFSFFPKRIPWSSITGIRYAKTEDKIPWNQPGHGERNKTLLLSLENGKSYFISAKDHARLYHLILKQLEKKS